MKRSFFVFTALALSFGSAVAQPVSISGTVDAGVSKSTDNTTKLQSSGSLSSQWTLAGQEDLGNGLKANFVLSSYVDPDTGASHGLGDRNAFVGLQSQNWGALRLGRSYNPVYSHSLTANGEFGVDGFQTLGTALNAQGLTVKNQVLYISPAWSGLEATLSYGFSEVKDASNHLGMGFRYRNGPVEATYAVAKPAGTWFGEQTKYLHQIGGAYDVGAARFLATVQHDENLVDNKYAYSLGVTAPVGLGTLWASYDHRQISTKDLNVLQLGYKYNMSKNTQIYGQVAYRSRATDQGLRGQIGELFGGGTDNAKGYGVGVAHSF